MAETHSTCRAGSDAASRPPARHVQGRAHEAFGSHRCEPAHAMQPPPHISTEPTPIWFAALMASSCLAVAGDSGHAVRWNHVSGRALYTNSGSNTETIEPLGVRLQKGHTVAVSWIPGETAYTVEVY